MRRAHRPLAPVADIETPALIDCTAAVSSASCSVSGGRMPGRRVANMVLPAPGGPSISRL